MARKYLGNIKSNDYVIDSGQLIDDTGSHFYEIYKNGFGNAWGFHILKGVDFESPLGEFHRATSPYDIDGLLNFDENSVSINIFIDNRTNNYNIALMTTVNSRGPYSIRLMNFNPAVVENVDIYVSYNYKGIVI